MRCSARPRAPGCRSCGWPASRRRRSRQCCRWGGGCGDGGAGGGLSGRRTHARAWMRVPLGACVMTPRLPAHRVTTAHMGAAYPFQAERGLGSRGVFMGRDVHGGGGFSVDPWEWYAQGFISNPNLVLFGNVGAGKSATLKAYCLRQLVFGRQAWFLDPKGEYDRLCAAAGVEPVRLQPGGAVRLNPLDPRVGGDVPPEQ